MLSQPKDVNIALRLVPKATDSIEHSGPVEKTVGGNRDTRFRERNYFTFEVGVLGEFHFILLAPAGSVPQFDAVGPLAV